MLHIIDNIPCDVVCQNNCTRSKICAYYLVTDPKLVPKLSIIKTAAGITVECGHYISDGSRDDFGTNFSVTIM